MFSVASFFAGVGGIDLGFLETGKFYKANKLLQYKKGCLEFAI